MRCAGVQDGAGQARQAHSDGVQEARCPRPADRHRQEHGCRCDCCAPRAPPRTLSFHAPRGSLRSSTEMRGAISTRACAQTSTRREPGWPGAHEWRGARPHRWANAHAHGKEPRANVGLRAAAGSIHACRVVSGGGRTGECGVLAACRANHTSTSPPPTLSAKYPLHASQHLSGRGTIPVIPIQRRSAAGPQSKEQSVCR